MIEIICGDSAELLKEFPDHTFDALCTDCPSSIGFMGKEWDKDKGGRNKWIAWLASILRECRRVMKPGAYGWVWALPRTQHMTATACEDAGFSVRDILDEAFPGQELLDAFVASLSGPQAQMFARLLECAAPSRLSHLFGTGFPKSRALLKPAVEQWILIKAPGELRELRIEENRISTTDSLNGGAYARDPSERHDGDENWRLEHGGAGEFKQPSGRWPANFALVHSDSCQVVGSKKVTGDSRARAVVAEVRPDMSPEQFAAAVSATAKMVMSRLDGSRPGGFADVGADKGDGKPCGPLYGDSEVEDWRCVDSCPVKMLDEQSGDRPTGDIKPYRRQNTKFAGVETGLPTQVTFERKGDVGGASRFFYTAKPSTKERSAGLPEGTRNTHPTVKSQALLRHLLRLIAAPGHFILDPFTGSGSCGVACLSEGMDFVGIEQDPAYVEIARARCKLSATT